MSVFPGAIPAAGTAVPTATLVAAGHTALHNTDRDEIRAIATKVGIDGSADVSTHDYKLAGIPDGDQAVTFLQMLDHMWPIGSIYTNATNSDNPGSLLGIGTWVAFGEGRVMVGLDSGQTEFDTAEETGGHKETQAHTHGATGLSTDSQGGSGTATFHGQGSATVLANTSGVFVAGISRTSYRSGGADTGGANSRDSFSINTAHTHTISGNTASYGNGNSGNLQPYIVVYIWKRTA